MRRTLAGDRASARALCRRLLPTVDRTLVRLLGSHEQDHDDLVQTTFEEISRTLGHGRFADQGSLRSWAFTIAARVAFGELRRRYRQRRLLVDPGSDADLGQTSELPRAGIEELELVRRALGSLKPGRAMVLYLHDVEGYSLAELAAMLDASVASVQSRLVRGRAQFENRYAELVNQAEKPGSDPARGKP